ncbi:flagellar filament capping protein FliD [Mangrovihabitans endophyticus]|uniref:Flagellar hook-associated protein 2 n=1 Tax=Mangrovihabitans endophyticus TaxID=1751298 RepID=A0A8J3BWE4_9ACTN|nr:flagellar filament capping protein FliD [Mangrovihabitans endophyticus]GGK82993.1 flagellar hook-associated protein 2 [Mangrovihabitans endophyticus]
MTSSVDGLVSGLSTSSLISQLMEVEAAPQTRLKSKVSAAETVVKSYQAVNTKLSALKGAADDLSQLSTWRAIKPVSNSTSVTATAVGGTNTTTGTMSFDVVQLAKGQVSTARVATSGDVTTSDSIEITIGSGDPVTIDISADKSAQGISDAINRAGIGVKSSVVTTGGAENILQLTGAKTGEGNAFTVTGLEDTGLMTAVAAQDAKLQVGGPDETGGFSVVSNTNTFTGLMAGVTVTVGKVETGVTLTVDSDVSGIAGKFQALVDAANAALDEVATQTAYDATTKKGSPLTGDFMVRQMSSAIMGTVSRGLSYTDLDGNDIAFGSLSKLGIELDRTGRLTFDQAKFTAAYNADPSTIKSAGIGFADAFEEVSKAQSDNVTSAITGRNNYIDSMNSQIDNWDLRLAARREALQKQYADLETALGKLQSQSTWLSGQIASLG